MSPLRLYGSLLAGVVVTASGIGYWVRHHRKTPEEREAERRLWLARIGRIIDGNVLDAHEIVVDGRGPLQLLIYNYDVAGVSYECAQDVTCLRRSLDQYIAKVGLPASVKYDPHNPSNSIVIAEGWSGLRN